jgi:hypothetical protein
LCHESLAKETLSSAILIMSRCGANTAPGPPDALRLNWKAKKIRLLSLCLGVAGALGAEGRRVVSLTGRIENRNSGSELRLALAGGLVYQSVDRGGAGGRRETREAIRTGRVRAR